MHKILLAFIGLALLTVTGRATDIDIASASIVGFNRTDLGSDTALTGVSVTSGSAAVSCSSCVPQTAVGMGGFKILLGSVVYDVASVSSRSSFTLTTNYVGATATIAGTWYKFALFRIYVSQAFTPMGSLTPIPAGAVGSQNWFRRYGVSVIKDGSQNIAYLPAIDNLPATTDGNPATSRYSGNLYTVGGTAISYYPGCISTWRLDAATPTTTWSQIRFFTLPPNPPPPDPVRYYTSAQIDSGIGRVCALNQGLYYAATGNIQSCLTFGSGLTVAGGVLTAGGTGALNNRTVSCPDT